MSLKATPEQELLGTSLRSWFAERCPLSAVRQVFEGKRSETKLDDLAELGLREAFTSDSPDESFGMQELCIVATQCGSALQPHALVEQLTALLIRRIDPSLPEKFFITETSSDAGLKVRYAPLGCEAALCIGSSSATLLDHPDVRVIEKLADRTHVRESLTFKAEHAKPVAPKTAKVARDLISLARAAEMAGVMRSAVTLTVEHVKTRKQFGTPIGSFQAVQHKIADLHLHTEALEKLVTFAGWAAQYSMEQRTTAALSARMLAAHHGAAVIEGCIQMHGGIGFTWEYDLHLYLRRAKFLEFLLEPTARIEHELIGAAVGDAA